MSRRPASRLVIPLCLLALGAALIAVATFGPASSRYVCAMLGLVSLGSGFVRLVQPRKPNPPGA